MSDEIKTEDFKIFNSVNVKTKMYLKIKEKEANREIFGKILERNSEIFLTLQKRMTFMVFVIAKFGLWVFFRFLNYYSENYLSVVTSQLIVVDVQEKELNEILSKRCIVDSN